MSIERAEILEQTTKWLIEELKASPKYDGAALEICVALGQLANDLDEVYKELGVTPHSSLRSLARRLSTIFQQHKKFKLVETK